MFEMVIKKFYICIYLYNEDVIKSIINILKNKFVYMPISIY